MPAQELAQKALRKKSGALQTADRTQTADGEGQREVAQPAAVKVLVVRMGALTGGMNIPGLT